MRLSVEPGDAGFHREAWRCEVFLNGARVRDAVTADEEKGEVIVVTGGRTATSETPRQRQRLTGVVAIRLDERWRRQIEQDLTGRIRG